MSNKQTTIKKSISLEGVGIHTGNQVKLTFMPAPADSGYIFKRIDYHQSIDFPHCSCNRDLFCKKSR